MAPHSLLLDLLWWQQEVAPPSPLAAAAEGYLLDGSSSPLLQAVVGALMQNILLE